MQKEGNYIVSDYLKKTLNLSFQEVDTADAETKALPLYLKGVFRYSLVLIENGRFMLLFPKVDADTPVSQIIKFSEQVTKQIHIPTLLCFDSMDSSRRRTLLAHRTNFVVPGKQIYIPSLFMYLNESGESKQAVNGKLSPAAQCLILYHLEVEALEGLAFKNIVEKLGYSKKTISMVVAELQQLEICEVSYMDARTKTIHFVESGRKLWNKVLPLMDSPVLQTYYADKDAIPSEHCFISSDRALAHYTFMANTRQHSVAIDKREFARNENEIIHPPIKTECIEIEVWKYNPALLAKGEEYIDRLSLYLLYKGSDDERIKKELNTLIDKMTW